MTEREHDPDRDVAAEHMVETPASLRDDDPEAPPMDRGADPADRPLGADKHGTTVLEQQQGESLDERLAEEVPEDAATPDEPSGEPAEEAAMHVEDGR
jgi:hypothetical protein